MLKAYSFILFILIFASNVANGQINGGYTEEPPSDGRRPEEVDTIPKPVVNPLVSEVYPNAVAVTFPEDIRSNRSIDLELHRGFMPDFNAAYFSKDSLPAVKKFYEGMHGAFKPEAIYGTVQNMAQMKNIYSKRIFTNAEAFALIQDHYGKPCGIQIVAVDKVKNAPMHNMRHSVRDIFLLRLEYFVITKQKTRAEYDALFKRYEKLFYAYYLLTETMFHETRLSADDVVYMKYSERIDKIMRGEIQLDQPEPTMPTERPDENKPVILEKPNIWGEWVKCLDEIEKEAFYTLIFISKHPTQWVKQTENTPVKALEPVKNSTGGH